MPSSEFSSRGDDRNYFHKYLRYAANVISLYKGNEPFHLFLKKYFSLNKKHGSKDRRIIASLCYNYFRLGFGVSIDIDIEERFMLSTWLCETGDSLLGQYSQSKQNMPGRVALQDKFSIVKDKFDKEKIFPFPNEISSEIDINQFNFSFLIQPKLFIRVRPGFKNVVLNKSKQANFLFEQLDENCISFSNNEKISNVIKTDEEAVVQDYNSQKTLNSLKPFLVKNGEEILVWDCCAGSGGKSILAFDLFKNIYITVSDKRKGILENLKDRFTKAFIKKYKLLNVDLEESSAELNTFFDCIIADVPCSGSGTWSRSPEQLLFFQKEDVEKYVSLQRKIIGNALSNLKSNGYLLYITCSVFKKENEENVAFFREKYHLNLIEHQYLKGCEMQADTMFVALLKKDE